MVDSQGKREQFLLLKMPKGVVVKSPSPDSEMRGIFFSWNPKSRNFCLWNGESWSLESRIQVSLTERIRYPIPGIRNPQRGFQNIVCLG